MAEPMNRNSYVSSDCVTEIESTIIIALLLIFVSQCTRLKYGAQLCINKNICRLYKIYILYTYKVYQSLNFKKYIFNNDYKT